jgi:hypothetical protein
MTFAKLPFFINVESVQSETAGKKEKHRERILT